MTVLRSRMEQLGYTRAERYGVTWRTKVTSGTIHRSTFTGNWHGVHLSGTRDLRIERNVFHHNGRHGMTLAVGCSNATVRGNQSYANAGLRISSGATQVTASKNLIDFNHRAGVFVADGTTEIGPANRLLDNEMGVWLSADARGTAVRGPPGRAAGGARPGQPDPGQPEGGVLGRLQGERQAVPQREPGHGQPGEGAGAGRGPPPADRVSGRGGSLYPLD
jgi:hypothetical protein